MRQPTQNPLHSLLSLPLFLFGCAQLSALTPSAPASAGNTPPSQVNPSGKYEGTRLTAHGMRPLESRSPAATTTQLKQAQTLAQTSPGHFQLGQIQIDAKARTLSFPVKLQMSEGVLEYALVHETGKSHEALFVTSVEPQDIHIAALLLNAVGQKPHIELTWRRNGPPARYPLADLVTVAGDQPDLLHSAEWSYQGSRFIGSSFVAQAEGSVIALITDGSALISGTHLNNQSKEAAQRSDGLFTPYAERLPPKDWVVTLILTFPPAAQ